MPRQNCANCFEKQRISSAVQEFSAHDACDRMDHAVSSPDLFGRFILAPLGRDRGRRRGRAPPIQECRDYRYSDNMPVNSVSSSTMRIRADRRELPNSTYIVSCPRIHRQTPVFGDEFDRVIYVSPLPRASVVLRSGVYPIPYWLRSASSICA